MTKAKMGKIRIIGGQWRGRKLPVIDRPGLRPTGDRARETLFNWLGSRIIDARCLDLFAGTGALGFEAASRGAREVVLVEKDRALAESLRAITAAWPGSEVVRVEHADALSWITNKPEPFDIVFIDPPFGLDLQSDVLERVGCLLKPDALVYLESAHDQASDHGERFETVRIKKQGQVMLQLLRQQKPEREAL
ncbi:MAG: 16S rRNA (guanine(966)-N(2))-methyltransferase RsmD [Wenzhouxiangella sp.]